VTSPTRLHLNESIYGACPAALDAARSALSAVSVYPDPARLELAGLLARHHDVAPEQVLIANGSDELVLLSALSIGDLQRPGVTTAGTFPGYRICLESTGRGCLEVLLHGPRTDVATLGQEMRQAGVAYVCNPHNPTGGALDKDELATLTGMAASSGTPLIVDEAYLDFAPEGTAQVRDRLAADLPLLSLRTFSKAYGLAALRIGYAIGSADLTARIRAVQGAMPFSVNRIAQAAAAAALGEQGFIRSVRARNADRREWFRGLLAERGGSSLPSVTNFVAVAVTDSALVAQQLAAGYGILVRDTAAFGFPGHLRVSLGQPEEMIRLLDALEALGALTRPPIPSAH
jgi:histidinol-phosphate aminotransferase